MSYCRESSGYPKQPLYLVRPGPVAALTGAESRVPVAVDRVDHDADHEPPAESEPGLSGQAVHDVDAGDHPERRHHPHERHLEGTLALRFGEAKHQDARAHERER